MAAKRKKLKYSRNDIYDLLNKHVPVATKKIGDKLGVKKTKRGFMPRERRILINQLWKLQAEGAIEHVSQKGYILLERIPKV